MHRPHLCCGTNVNKLDPGCVRWVRDHNLRHDPKFLQLPQQTNLYGCSLLVRGSC